MQSAYQFCNLRETITLASTTSRIRNDPLIARTLRIMREALEGCAHTDYLCYLGLICQRPYDDASVPQLLARIVAHAMLSHESTLAELATHELGELGNIDEIISKCAKIRGDRDALPKHEDGRLNSWEIEAIARIIAEGRANRAHYEWIDTCVARAQSIAPQMRATQTVATCIYSVMTVVYDFGATRAARGEWIECWFTRDVLRACAIFPFSSATTHAIFDCEIDWIIAHDRPINATIGPRLARLLLSNWRYSDIIAQFAYDTPEIAACIAALRSAYARKIHTSSAITADWELNEEQLSVRYALLSAAKNPDERVFALVLNTTRELGGIESELDMMWQYYEGVECFVRIIERLESANIHMQFRGVGHTIFVLPYTICVLPRSDALRYAELVLPRVLKSSQLLQEKASQIKFQAGCFLRAIEMFGEPLASIIRANYGCAPPFN